MQRTVLPIEHLRAWAKLNGIKFNNVTVEKNIAAAGGEGKGAGVVATEDFSDDDGEEILMTVPADLILTKEQVKKQAALDKNIQRILDDAGEFGETSRGAILIFLLLQITQSSPDFDGQVLTSSPFTDYVKLLPESVLLPTLYTTEEKDLLIGTTLWDALNQKICFMEDEFADFYENTKDNSWAQKYWWDEKTGKLDFSDWLLVDALYRSRALDLPNIGHAMVPCVDMANHSAVADQKATYESKPDGSATLERVGHGRTLGKGEEVTINYGDEKGACEMLFSYGFLDPDMSYTRAMFLGLDIPQDDPLRILKRAVNKEMPGIKLLSNDEGQPGVQGDFIWWNCVNEEDGLNFRVAQDTSGDQQVEMLWHDELVNASDLRQLLQDDPRAPIFRLRVIVLLMDIIEVQGESMLPEDAFLKSREQEGVRIFVWEHISKLRRLETNSLVAAWRDLNEQKSELLEEDIVKEYLRNAQVGLSPEEDGDDDFA